MTEGNQPWQDADILRTLYYHNDNTASEIAAKLDCSRRTVLKWLNRHDIPKHPWQEYRAFHTVYVQHGMSIQDIADYWDADPDTIRRWKNRHGFEAVDDRTRDSHAIRRTIAD